MSLPELPQPPSSSSPQPPLRPPDMTRPRATSACPSPANAACLPSPPRPPLRPPPSTRTEHPMAFIIFSDDTRRCLRLRRHTPSFFSTSNLWPWTAPYALQPPSSSSATHAELHVRRRHTPRTNANWLTPPPHQRHECHTISCDGAKRHDLQTAAWSGRQTPYPWRRTPRSSTPSSSAPEGEREDEAELQLLLEKWQLQLARLVFQEEDALINEQAQITLVS
ncbi:hypothetical protein PVAP13_5NG514872 [Panicum virgatum]|uniref:Uncharacterized protein n=1 Tax=Panicum virgatum TaxID=38727 RepID=A0A8T0S573_PANVG|nr:hypothetical protein PVAP13_5NG514872 [Panicum virgatum]